MTTQKVLVVTVMLVVLFRVLNPKPLELGLWGHSAPVPNGVDLLLRVFFASAALKVLLDIASK